MFIFDIYSGHAIRLKKNNSIKYIYTYWLSPLNLSTTIAKKRERERDRITNIFSIKSIFKGRKKIIL